MRGTVKIALAALVLGGLAAGAVVALNAVRSLDAPLHLAAPMR